MKSTIIQTEKKAAFTIVELLTVMSIIVILIGLLVPALNSVRRYAAGVKQQAQFNAMAAGLEMYRNDFEEYPDSKGIDLSGIPYCGAMKLAEAMVGQDLLGFHPQSTFQSNSSGLLYRLTDSVEYEASLAARKDPYLPVDKVSVFQLDSIYPDTGTAFSPQTAEMFVLTDVFKRAQNLGTTGPSKAGMPILYFKASESGRYHDSAVVNIGTYSAPGNIYNYCDNQDIIDLQLPGAPGSTDPDEMHVYGSSTAGIEQFYNSTEDVRIRDTTGGVGFRRPFRPESFILISAGYDGRYGTSDDVTNFEQQ